MIDSKKLERFHAAESELQSAVADILADIPHKAEVSTHWTPVYTFGSPTKWLMETKINVSYNIFPYLGENL